jgi:hypothetical protein
MWVSRTACEEWVWLHGSFQDVPRFRVQGIDFSAAQIDFAISSARNSTRVLTIKRYGLFLRVELTRRPLSVWRASKIFLK